MPIMNTIIAISFAAACSAGAMSYSNQTAPNCHDLMLSVPVKATTYDLGQAPITSNTGVSELAAELDRWSRRDAKELVVAEVHVDDTFSIYAQLCFPKPETAKDVLQILTHGGGFDHRYWDSQLDPEQYNYVQAAINAGYTVLNYDRLGTGLSEKPDAYTVVQINTELEILHALTAMVEKGTLIEAAQPGYFADAPPHLSAFSKVVHVGHSLGSQTTFAYLEKYGAESSGAILTGFVFSSHGETKAGDFGYEYAVVSDPTLFSDSPDGYLVVGTPTALQTGFFHRWNGTDPAGFTDEALAYGFSIRSTVTAGEAWSIFGLFEPGPVKEFKGPVQLVVGEYDYLVCGGDCKEDYDLATFEAVFPAAAKIEPYIQPGAGHGLPLHLNASAGFAVSLNFLSDNGL